MCFVSYLSFCILVRVQFTYVPRATYEEHTFSYICITTAHRAGAPTRSDTERVLVTSTISASLIKSHNDNAMMPKCLHAVVV